MSTPQNPLPNLNPQMGQQPVPPPRKNVMMWILVAIGVLFVCMMFAGLMILRTLQWNEVKRGTQRTRRRD